MNFKKLIYGITIVAAAGFMACTNAVDYDLDTPEEVKEIYSETFANGLLGGFTTQSVVGDQEWVGEAKGYAIMSGYINATKENIPNEDWLISPEIDLTEVTTAHFTFEHVTRYFENVAEEATVWISENYTSGLPSTAEWTQLKTNPFRDPGAWEFNSSGQISLTQYAGKKVHIAFKYISTANKAGTWEVKNFVVSSGEAVVVEVNYGKGTAKEPYTVAGGIGSQNQTGKWVNGLIVGYVWYPTDYIFGADTCTQNLNLLIADTPENTYLSQSIAVQLPAGAVRDGLNLKDHKELLGKRVSLYGDLAKYFGISGLKNVSYYVLEDGTTGGVEPFDPSDAIFYESFATSLGNFTTQSVLGAETWVYNSQYKCAYVSGYVGGKNKENEDWLISPEIDLTGKTNVRMTFDHALRYNANAAQDATVWVSENYVSGLPSTANWVQVPTNFKDGTDWTFVNVGDFSLADFEGKKIKIALMYKATNTKAGTWEVKNFIVK